MAEEELLGRPIIEEICTGPKETIEGNLLPPRNVKIRILVHLSGERRLHSCPYSTSHGFCGTLLGLDNKGRLPWIPYEKEIMQPPCPNSPFGQVNGVGMLIG